MSRSGISSPDEFLVLMLSVDLPVRAKRG